jgi:hypothetical protein
MFWVCSLVVSRLGMSGFYSVKSTQLAFFSLSCQVRKVERVVMNGLFFFVEQFRLVVNSVRVC